MDENDIKPRLLLLATSKYRSMWREAVHICDATVDKG
jgi:hypothetical protein